AEEAADVILRRLRVPRTATSRERLVPGGDDYPDSPEALHAEQSRLAARHGLPLRSIIAVWKLYGTRASEILRQCGGGPMLAGTTLPRSLADWIIEHEWGAGLDDLVCRRLMLLYEPGLSRATLEALADVLVESGRMG